MCDQDTAIAEEQALRSLGLSRRAFALAGTATALWATTASARAAGLAEATVSVPTPDGPADAFFVHPAKGAHSAILVWPDIAGLRDVYKSQARRLAAAGYAVLVLNQYHRSARAPVLATFAEWRTPEGQARLKPMIAAVTPAGVAADAAACVAFLDRQPAVSTRRGIGTVGYCMGGPFAVRSAAAAPARIRAVASMHGGGLVADPPAHASATAPQHSASFLLAAATATADARPRAPAGSATVSPHRLFAWTRARFLFAIARNDDAKNPGDKEALRAAAAAAHRPAEIEVYDADHGWTTPDTPVYDHAQAEKAWGRMLALFSTL